MLGVRPDVPLLRKSHTQIDHALNHSTVWIDDTLRSYCCSFGRTTMQKLYLTNFSKKSYKCESLWICVDIWYSITHKRLNILWWDLAQIKTISWIDIKYIFYPSLLNTFPRMRSETASNRYKKVRTFLATTTKIAKKYKRSKDILPPSAWHSHFW